MTDERCGAETTQGHACQNPAESCPWHDVDDPPENGRPSKLETHSETIISLIKDGHSLTQAVKESEVTDSTVYSRMKKGHSDSGNGEYQKFLDKLKQTEWWEYKQRFQKGDSSVEVECELCENSKLVTLSRAEKYDRHICSEHNPAELQSIGGTTRTYMGPNWHTQRQRALERDSYSCQSCGMDEQKHLERFDQELHVHHIIARKHFDDDDPEQNELSNLTTLCRECHEAYEGCSISPVHRMEA